MGRIGFRRILGFSSGSYAVGPAIPNEDNLRAAYKEYRAKENYDRVRVAFVMVAVALIVINIVHHVASGVGLTGGEAMEDDDLAVVDFVLVVLLLLVLAGLGILQCAPFAKVHCEGFACGLATTLLLAFLMGAAVEDAKIAAMRNNCDVTWRSAMAPMLDDGTDEPVAAVSEYEAPYTSNPTSPHPTTSSDGGTCAERLFQALSLRTTAEHRFVVYYARWMTAATFFALFLRLRYLYNLVVVGVSGLALAVMTSAYTLHAHADGDLQKQHSKSAVSVMFDVLVSYIPGVALCLWVSWKAELDHRENWIKGLEIRKLLKKKELQITSQKRRLSHHMSQNSLLHEELSEKNILVTKYLEDLSIISSSCEIPYKDIEWHDKIGEGAFGAIYARRSQQLYGGCWNEGSTKLAIVLELCELGSLKALLKSGELGTWREPRFKLALGVAACLEYLHHDLADPLIHRDIKPDNVLVAKRGGELVAKVADFGESRHINAHHHTRPAALSMSDLWDSGRELNTVMEEGGGMMMELTMVGTEIYAAPEVLSGNYTEKIDVFSYGLLLLEVALSNTGYVRAKHRSAFRKGGGRTAYLNGWRPAVPSWLEAAQPELVALVRECWQEDPALRPPFTEVRRRLVELPFPRETGIEHEPDNMRLRRASTEGNLLSGISHQPSHQTSEVLASTKDEDDDFALDEEPVQLIWRMHTSPSLSESSLLSAGMTTPKAGATVGKHTLKTIGSD